MAIHFKKIVVYVFALATVQGTCNKRIDCSQAIYSFEIQAKAFPDQDSINVGDTIWVLVDEPIQMQNLSTNNVVNFQGAENLGTAISFIELLGNKQLRNAANDFGINLVIGNQISNPYMDLMKEFLFSELNNSYKFKVAIIPKKTGIFRISLSDAANVYTKNDKCSKASFRINFKETNQHMYFNESNFNVAVPLPNNNYCFKVKS